MINTKISLSIRSQCALLKIHRSTLYYKEVVPDDTILANALVDIYRSYPVYGYRRLTACLKRQGYPVNAKRVLRLMRQMGLRAIYPAPRTTIVDKKQHKYPYLLADRVITRPHQAWQIDITYLRTDHGFMYMNALIDMYTRYVVGWSLSITLDTEACLRTLEKSLNRHETPPIINSDQGCQFTSNEWTKALKNQDIQISMSGKGRSNDNAYVERLWRTLKYEWLFIQGAKTVADYKRLLPEFIHWYNYQRPHQALAYQTPCEVLSACLREHKNADNDLTFMNENTLFNTVKNSLVFTP